MKLENLRSLIREGIAEWVKEMDMAAEAASHSARIASLEEAIATREARLTSMTEGEHAEYLDQAKIKELQNEIKELKKHKVKFEKAAEKQAAKHAKKSAPKEDVVTDTEIEEAPIATEDVMAEMGTEEVAEETAINESFLKMQKLAGVITEAEYNQKKRLVENYTPPAYEAINDLMDYINMNTGIKGRIVPYRSISWLPSVSDADGDMDMLVYKKGEYEIAIGADDVYQSTDDPDSNVWIIDSNDPNAYFEEHMTFDEAENAASEWLKS